jgi:transcriptional regulator NrdR family protein
MTKVIKRGGKKQAFNSSKLKKSVQKACRDAKLSSSTKKEVLNEVVIPTIAVIKKRKVIRSTDIRKLLLKKLGKHSKGAAKAWKSFEKKKK